MLLLSRGASPTAAAEMISAYALGVIAGRLSCGLALDRFAPDRLACICLGLPALGLGWLALSIGGTWGLTIAVMILGLSLGTELDVAGVLIMRFFPREVFSTALGLIIAGVALSGTIGFLALSLLLHLQVGFVPWLAGCAVSALAGSICFLRLPEPMEVPRWSAPLANGSSSSSRITTHGSQPVSEILTSKDANV